MKKTLALLMALICLCILASGCSDKMSLTGRFLKCDDGTVMIICESEPVIMSDASKRGGLFDGLDNGDLIRISCSPILETWPASTGAYSCRRLADGAESDLPAQTLDQLSQLGWSF